MIIDGNLMYKNNVEQESLAAQGRKLAASTGSGEAALCLGVRSGEDRFAAFEESMDNFFNRDNEQNQNTFNPLNRYYVNLERLRTHIRLCHREWSDQITGNVYRDVNLQTFRGLIRRLDQLSEESGDLLPIGEMERRAGGIRYKAPNKQQLYIRPLPSLEGDEPLAWTLFRQSILRVSRTVIERFENNYGGFDYHFYLVVHPRYTEALGYGNFEAYEELVTTEREFLPSTVEDTRRSVQRRVSVRTGQSQFRELIREAYNDTCPITGCDDERGMQAAHIIPYMGEETNHVTNGILLRNDIHRLFDHQDGPFLRIEIQEGEWIVRVDESLIQSTYGELHGRTMNLPNNLQHWPNLEALRLAGWLVD